jgi:CcmD family protein
VTPEQLPPTNLSFLAAAFAVTWIVFFVYAFFVSRRRQELQQEVRDLQREAQQEDDTSHGEG